MRIKSIYIDGLHNAVNKTYDFGDINYIFGNNGIGKSTILQAIQFALLGYIPGTSKSSREALLRHSPCNKIHVRLALTDNDGQDIMIERKVVDKASKLITMPDGYDIASIISEIEVPIFNFDEFVGQTANKLKEYFIKNILPTANGELDWQKILTDSISDCQFADKDAIVDYGMSVIGNLDGDTLDQVVDANSKFKSEQSFNKSELQRLQNTIDSLIYYDEYTGPTNMEELTANLLSVGAIRDQLIKYNSAVEATRSANEELNKLEESVKAMGGQEKYEELSKQLTVLREKYKTDYDIVESNKRVVVTMRAADKSTESIVSSKGVCPYTKESCKSILAKIEDIRNESVTRKAEIMTMEQEISNQVGALRSLQNNIQETESVVASFTNKFARIESLRKSLGELPVKPDTDKTVQELTAEMDILSQNKTQLQANIQYNAAIDNLTKLKYEAELQGKALSCWVKTTDTNGLQTTLMEKPFNELADTMTGYICAMYGRDDIKAHFNISNKANSFSFGMIRGGVYIPYDLLSSGEKCLYTLALMICIVNNSKSPLKVMLCDDMFDHLDATAIENTFDSLKKVNDIQFIFAGVKECKNAEDLLITV